MPAPNLQQKLDEIRERVSDEPGTWHFLSDIPKLLAVIEKAIDQRNKESYKLYKSSLSPTNTAMGHDAELLKILESK